MLLVGRRYDVLATIRGEGRVHSESDNTSSATLSRTVAGVVVTYGEARDVHSGLFPPLASRTSQHSFCYNDFIVYRGAGSIVQKARYAIAVIDERLSSWILWST